MNKKPLTVTSIAAVFAALTMLSACDKRDNAATPPTPQATPSPSTTPSTTPPATGGTGMTPSDGASAPATGASQ